MRLREKKVRDRDERIGVAVVVSVILCSFAVLLYAAYADSRLKEKCIDRGGSWANENCTLPAGK